MTVQQNAQTQLQDYINDNNLTELTINDVKNAIPNYLYYNIIDDLDKFNEELDSEIEEFTPYQEGDDALILNVELPTENYMIDNEGNIFYENRTYRISITEVYQSGCDVEYYTINIK